MHAHNISALDNVSLRKSRSSLMVSVDLNLILNKQFGRTVANSLHLVDCHAL